MELANMAANKNTVPGDKSALTPGGIRIGWCVVVSGVVWAMEGLGVRCIYTHTSCFRKPNTPISSTPKPNQPNSETAPR